MDQTTFEQHIARGLCDGQVDAWRALYDRYAREVWSMVARQMAAAATEVADVVQETFMAAAHSARQYDAARGSLKMWLCGIARRHVALHYRGQQRRQRLQQGVRRDVVRDATPAAWRESNEPGPSELLAQAETGGLVREALANVPLEYEMLLRARYFEDVSVEQLAANQQRSVVAIRAKLARARRAFRKALGTKVTP